MCTVLDNILPLANNKLEISLLFYCSVSAYPTFLCVSKVILNNALQGEAEHLLEKSTAFIVFEFDSCT